MVEEEVRLPEAVHTRATLVVDSTSEVGAATLVGEAAK